MYMLFTNINYHLLDIKYDKYHLLYDNNDNYINTSLYIINVILSRE